MYIIFVQNVRICRKIDFLELCKLNGKLCTLYTFGTSGFVEKLNVQNPINSTENFVHYTYGMFEFEEKLIAIAAQIQWEIVYIIRTKCLNL